MKPAVVGEQVRNSVSGGITSASTHSLLPRARSQLAYIEVYSNLYRRMYPQRSQKYIG